MSARARDWPVFRSLSGYAARDVSGDVIAGLTLAAIAIPEQMATARLGGFSPETGFAAFIAGALGFALLGANRFLSAGADSTITPIFAGGLAALAAAGSAQYDQMAAMLALLVGAILIGGGLARVGWIADLLSVPVMTGFLAGISVHITVSQLPAVLGITAPHGILILQIVAIVRQLASTNLDTLGLGFGVLALTLGAERISAKIPGALIGLVSATLCVVVFGLQRHGVAVLGTLQGGLPPVAVPAIHLNEILPVLPLSVMVAMVVMVQTAATSRSFVASPDDPVDINRDFIGMGAGGLIAGLFGAFPIDASPPRTGIVLATGGRSQLTSLTAAAIVLALSVFGMALLAHVPYAGLSGILLFVAGRLIRLAAVIEIFRQSRAEFLLILATMISIVVLPIEIGVAVGIILSLVHGMWTTTQAGTITLERLPGTTIWWPPTPTHPGETLAGVCVLAFQGPLSFLNAYQFKNGVMQAVASQADPLKLMVLEASSIAEIDYTAAQILTGLIRRHQKLGINVAIARLESVRARAAFDRFGIVNLIGEDHFFHSVDEAVRHWM